MFSLQVLGAVAQLERALIAERTKAGLRAARSRDRVGGNPGLRAGDPDAIRKVRAGRDAAHLNGVLAHLDLNAARRALGRCRARPEPHYRVRHAIVMPSVEAEGAVKSNCRHCQVNRFRDVCGQSEGDSEPSRCSMDAGFLSPSPERLRANASIAGCGHEMAPRPEVTVDHRMRRQKPLCLAG